MFYEYVGAWAHGENDYRRQDQLIGVPEPVVLLLLGAGLIGFSEIGRKGVKD